MIARLDYKPGGFINFTLHKQEYPIYHDAVSKIIRNSHSRGLIDLYIFVISHSIASVFL
jgi:hypothetical protein